MPPGVRGGSSATSSGLSPQRPSIGQYSSFLRLRHPGVFFPFFRIWVRISPLSRGRPPESSLPHGWLTVYVFPLPVSSPRLASACSPRAPTVRRERHVNPRRSRLTRQPNALSSESEPVNNDRGRITHPAKCVGRRLLHCLIVLSASSRVQAYFLHEYSTCTSMRIRRTVSVYQAFPACPVPAAVSY